MKLGTYIGEGGDRSLLCDSVHELRLRGTDERMSKVINGIKNKEEQKLSHHRVVPE